MKPPNLDHWLRHPASITGDDLYAAAQFFGFVLRNRRGSHFILTRPGRGGHLTIKINVAADGTKRAIIRELIAAREEFGYD